MRSGNVARWAAALGAAFCLLACRPVLIYAGGPLISGLETEDGPAEGPALEAAELAGEAAGDGSLADTTGSVTDITAGLTGIIVSEEELSDSRIEYRELEALVRTGNSNAINQQNSYADQLSNYQAAYDAFISSRRDMLNEAEALEEEDGDGELIAFYEQNAEILTSSAKQMKRSLNSLQSISSEASRNRSIWSLVKSAQSLMASCKEMEAQAAVAEKTAEARQAAYDRAEKERAAGLATEEELLSAGKNLLAARISLQSARDSEAQLKRQLARMLGISSDGFEIGELPQVTAEELSAVSLEQDKAAAIIADSGVKSVKNSSARGSAERSLRRQQLSEAEGEASVSMDEQYNQLAAHNLSRDAAVSAFSAAEKDYRALQLQYQAGMINKGDFLSGEADYLRKKAGWLTAEAELRLAYDSYRWMLKGVN